MIGSLWLYNSDIRGMLRDSTGENTKQMTLCHTFMVSIKGL